MCTFVKDIRTLSEAHDPEFVKILQQIRVITTLMNDSSSLDEAAKNSSTVYAAVKNKTERRESWSSRLKPTVGGYKNDIAPGVRRYTFARRARTRRSSDAVQGQN
jgi:hypothetical protein